MSQRRIPCLFILLCAIGGISLSEIIELSAWPFLIVSSFLAFLVLSGFFVKFRQLGRPEALMLVTLFFGLHQIGWHAAPARRIAEALLATPKPRDFQVEITSDPSPAGRGRWGVHCRVLTVDGLRVVFPAYALLRGEIPHPGDKLILHAHPMRPARPLNPGQFDFGAQLARRGIFLEIHTKHPSDVLLESRGVPAWHQHLMRTARSRLAHALTCDLEFDPIVSAVILGIVLGKKDDMDPALVEGFQLAGALHVFSVSGLHVGMVGLLAWMVLGPFGLGPRTRSVVVLCAVWLYAAVTGGNIPAMRAALMASVLGIGVLFRREGSLVNSISAAGVLMLAADTNALFQVGFQLSFSAVLAISTFAERFGAPLRRLFKSDPLIPEGLLPRWRRWVSASLIRFAELLTVSLTAGIGTLLFSAWHFSLVTPGGVVTNVIAVPLAFCVLAIGLLSVALSFVAPWLGILANNTNWLVTKCLLQITLFFGSQQWSSIPGHPAAWSKPTAELWALALNDGSSVVLRAGSQTWLVGPGSKEDYRRIVRPFLRWYGVARLDGLILPQGDARHYGGATQCVDELHPREIFQVAVHDRSPTRAKFNAYLETAEIRWRELAAGNSIELPAGIRIEILHPKKQLQTRMAGERALVMKIRSRLTTILLCAEPPFRTQSQLAALGPEILRSDVCIIGRSRVDPVSNPQFLYLVSARLWIWTGQNFMESSEQIEPGAVLLHQTGSIRLRLDPGPVAAEGFRTGPLQNAFTAR